jgi:hypothetical protein
MRVVDLFSPKKVYMRAPTQPHLAKPMWVSQEISQTELHSTKRPGSLRLAPRSLRPKSKAAKQRVKLLNTIESNNEVG